MIRYTVEWHRSAEDELAEIWLAAVDRPLVSAAANLIDRELGDDSDQKGSFVALDIFELIVPPLRVFYRLSIPDRKVSVLYVKRA